MPPACCCVHPGKPDTWSSRYDAADSLFAGELEFVATLALVAVHELPADQLPNLYAEAQERKAGGKFVEKAPLLVELEKLRESEAKARLILQRLLIALTAQGAISERLKSGPGFSIAVNAQRRLAREFLATGGKS